jgi:hypothetical protein
MGWHLAVWVFPPRITRERPLKPPGPDLIRGGVSPYLILWREAFPGLLSPLNGDPGSTQILTQHYGAKSQTISYLMNSGTTPTRQVPIVQPLQTIKILEVRIDALAAPLSNNPNGTTRLH